MPDNPIVLLSFLNTKLRDQYDSLDALCDDYDVSVEDIITKMATINYIYDPETNQFK